MGKDCGWGWCARKHQKAPRKGKAGADFGGQVGHCGAFEDFWGRNGAFWGVGARVARWLGGQGD